MKDDMKKQAKLSVLKEMREMASGMMGKDLKTGMEAVKKANKDTMSTRALKVGHRQVTLAEDKLSDQDDDRMPNGDRVNGVDNSESGMGDIDRMNQHSHEEIDTRLEKLREAKRKRLLES